MSRNAKIHTTIDHDDVARFAAQADLWWDEQGPFAPLHRLNPLRIEYVRDQIASHFHRETGSRQVLQGLKLLDVGCGGGLLAEPLARLGAEVTGIDAAEASVETARAHAKASGLKIDYRAGEVSDLDEHKKYDIITALEIVEHVSELGGFITSLAQRLKPNGLLILSTLNRTPASFLLGIVAAEYILRWVPQGTHDWRKFVKPSELAAELRLVGLYPKDITGMVFSPLTGGFVLRQGKVAVNYLMTAKFSV